MCMTLKIRIRSFNGRRICEKNYQAVKQKWNKNYKIYIFLPEIFVMRQTKVVLIPKKKKKDISGKDNASYT